MTPLQRMLEQSIVDPMPPFESLDGLIARERRRRRHRRLAVAGAAAVATLAVVSASAFVGPPGSGQGLAPAGPPLTGAPSGTATEAVPAVCESATDEAQPPAGAPPQTWPDFVHTVIERLPSRDDYQVQWAFGICPIPDGAPNAARMPNARVIINLGPDREHGLLTVELYHALYPGGLTCANRSGAAQVLSCEDATATTPTVLVTQTDRELAATAVYRDGRTVMVVGRLTPLDAAALRAVATDRDLAAFVA